MRVRITAYINGQLGPDRYAYYPGQEIVDHEHAAEWVARGEAVPLEENALARVREDTLAPKAESGAPSPNETRRNRRR